MWEAFKYGLFVWAVIIAALLFVFGGWIGLAWLALHHSLFFHTALCILGAIAFICVVWITGVVFYDNN